MLQFGDDRQDPLLPEVLAQDLDALGGLTAHPTRRVKQALHEDALLLFKALEVTALLPNGNAERHYRLPDAPVLLLAEHEQHVVE